MERLEGPACHHRDCACRCFTLLCGTQRRLSFGCGLKQRLLRCKVYEKPSLAPSTHCVCNQSCAVHIDVAEHIDRSAPAARVVGARGRDCVSCSACHLLATALCGAGNETGCHWCAAVELCECSGQRVLWCRLDPIIVPAASRACVQTSLLRHAGANASCLRIPVCSSASAQRRQQFSRLRVLTDCVDVA